MTDSPSEDPRARVASLLNGLPAQQGRDADELFTLVYADLRRLATARMARLPPGQTIQATALVNEVYVSLVGTGDPGWKGRAHFFGAAAKAMRNILADHLERKHTLKRGGHLERAGEKTSAELSVDGPSDDELDVEEALQALELEYPRNAEVVTLRFFGGLNTTEIAEVMKLSPRTVERDWQFAKAWLNSRLGKGNLAS